MLRKGTPIYYGNYVRTPEEISSPVDKTVTLYRFTFTDDSILECSPGVEVLTTYKGWVPLKSLDSFTSVGDSPKRKLRAHTFVAVEPTIPVPPGTYKLQNGLTIRIPDVK